MQIVVSGLVPVSVYAFFLCTSDICWRVNEDLDPQ